MNAFNLEKAMKYYDNNVSFGSAKIVYKGELGLLKNVSEKSKRDKPFFMYCTTKIIIPATAMQLIKKYWKGSDFSYGLGFCTLINVESSKSPVGEFGWDGAEILMF